MRNFARERWNDLATVARVLKALDRLGQEAAAYDHAAHGCPFEDTDFPCPVGCDAPDNIANETLAFFGGLAQ